MAVAGSSVGFLGGEISYGLWRSIVNPGEGAPKGTELVLRGVQSWVGFARKMLPSSWPGEDCPDCLQVCPSPCMKML